MAWQAAAVDGPDKNLLNGVGYAYPHAALDDHTRLAHTEVLPDRTTSTCAGFLTRATAWFAARGINVERVLNDNAWAHTKNDRTCASVPEAVGAQSSPTC